MESLMLILFTTSQLHLTLISQGKDGLVDRG